MWRQEIFTVFWHCEFYRFLLNNNVDNINEDYKFKWITTDWTNLKTLVHLCPIGQFNCAIETKCLFTCSSVHQLVAPRPRLHTSTVAEMALTEYECGWLHCDCLKRNNWYAYIYFRERFVDIDGLSFVHFISVDSSHPPFIMAGEMTENWFLWFVEWYVYFLCR